MTSFWDRSAKIVYDLKDGVSRDFLRELIEALHDIDHKQREEIANKLVSNRLLMYYQEIASGTPVEMAKKRWLK